MAFYSGGEGWPDATIRVDREDRFPKRDPASQGRSRPDSERGWMNEQEQKANGEK